MNSKIVRTWTPKGAEAAAQRQWWLVDAEGQTLGRLAGLIARLLRGKHKPTFTPHMDMGDFVVVINASKIAVTGQKMQKKMYYRHSNFPGGFRAVPFAEQIRRHPEAPVEHAVRGMLPRGPLGDNLYRKLHVYGGPAHPHQAQQPTPWPMDTVAEETGQNR
jgi:large subunit ribosomal protein L13